METRRKMMENQNLRIEKGTEAPSEKGEGSTYFIPRDDMPEGIKSGEKIKLIIEGLVNVDEQGLSIKADKIYVEDIDSRNDPTQSGIEDGLNIEIGIKK
jgi:hypothetical protein